MHSQIVDRSREFYVEISRLNPGGVNSGGRYWPPFPFFAKRGDGSKIFDINGREYIDYVMGYGPLIFGHARPRSMIEAVERQLREGAYLGQTTELDYKLAKEVTSVVPCARKVKFCTSGSEANNLAIRAARVATGREKIAKFEGAYNGGADSLYASDSPPLDRAGPAKAPLAVLSSGIAKNAAENIVVLPFNDTDAVQSIVDREKDEIAALVVDPILTYCGPLKPKKGFLEFLRKITREYGIVLIFDEVVTGFRLALGGAQEYFGVVPDMTAMGKALGGGLPIGLVAGNEETMNMFDPSSPGGSKVAFYGTFNGNSLTVAAANAVIDELKNRRVYDHINKLGDELRSSLQEASSKKLPFQVIGVGSLFNVCFTDREIVDYRSAATADKELQAKLRTKMLEKGILPHRGLGKFISYSHTKEDVNKTVQAFKSTLQTLK